jgi:hypothetical protein
MSDNTDNTDLISVAEQIDELKHRINAGESGLANRLDVLLRLRSKLETDPEPDEDPLLARLSVKTRKYTMTPAALEARRNNAQKSTGPTTAEGKDTSSRNAWKHGLHSRNRVLGFGKPCRKTCPHYPCRLVNDGDTAPGKDCLDKEYLAETMHAISKALETGDLADLKSVVTLQLGQSLQVIDELQASILQYGVYMKSEKINKDGEVIGYELKPNPSLLPLSNLLKAAGVTLPEFMATPKEINRDKSDREAVETVADIFRVAGEALKAAEKKP